MARRGPTNFDQAFPGPATPLPYQISVEVEVFIRALNEYYERSVREEVADAPHHAIGDFPLLDRWQQLGYPSLGEMIAHAPEVLEPLIKDWFDQDVLDRIIPGPQNALPRFLVNTIDRVTIDKDLVRIEGNAYLHPQLQKEDP
jgi:hypothetical protein